MQKIRSIWQNPVTITGVVVSLLAVLFFIAFQLLDVFSGASNPYTGLWTFLILPIFLILGLILVPIGWVLERRRRRRLSPDVKEYPRFPQIDFNNPHHRKAIATVAAVIMLVIPLIGVSSYKGYHYTDSTQFCGQVCHSVMSPEHTSYLNSPHARVSCAACHIGPGASWYVKSKISGVRQVLAVTFNTYSRPIPTPIENLRPARETCEECHWPAKFYGSQLRTRVHYASDENNTRREIRVLVKTGGADSSMGPAGGIHYHMALSEKIQYIATDSERQVIPWVKATYPSGAFSVFRSDGKTSEDPPPPGDVRTIDCIDCHNRPTHIIQPPDRAVNISLETGRLDRTMPFMKKVAVEALTEPYSSSAEANDKIASYIRDFYEKFDSKLAAERQSAINQAIDEVRAIYRRNFFPEMKVDWRTHPDNIGHMVFDGCYRCHDNKHISNDRGAIRKDCTVCHEFQLPIPDGVPPGTAKQITPEHPYKLEGIHAELKCSSCHTGGRGPVPSCAGCHVTQALFRQGKSPTLPGLTGSPPTLMASLECENCHDLSKPQTTANLTAQCETCHDKGYGDMLKMWKDDAKAGRVKASAAIDELRSWLKNHPVKRDQAATVSALADQLQAALDQVDKAGAHHNTDFADAIYQQIIKSVADTTGSPKN